MEYVISSGFLERARRLTLTDEYIEWENGDQKGREFTRLNKSDIIDFKHGMNWIVWYRFTVGQSFSITFLDRNKKELQIRFNSHFGLHKENFQKYADIVENIWTLFHSDIVDGFLKRFHNQEEIQIHGAKLKREGVELSQSRQFIPWDKVTTRDYETYFAIFDKDNSAVHQRISYNEYGTETLWGALRIILNEKL